MQLLHEKILTVVHLDIIYSRKMTDSDVMLIDFGIAIFNFQCVRPASNIIFKKLSAVKILYGKIYIT